MNLSEIANKKSAAGTYAAVRFTKESCEELKQLCKTLKVPDPVPRSKLHTTIIYSKNVLNDYEIDNSLKDQKLNDYKDDSLKLEIWKTQGGQNCLVAKYKSKLLNNRFKYAMSIGGTFDYEVYTPHITLSYDVGEDFILPKGKITCNIICKKEYCEPLNLNYLG